MFTSQPVSAFRSQLPKPAVHRIPHCPARQPTTPFRALHFLPHEPQLPESDAMLVSQPLAGLASQSAQPLLQTVTTQIAAEHALAAFGKLHRLPQNKQLLGSFSESTSQPLLLSPSQSSVVG